jgi:hypothetical protein
MSKLPPLTIMLLFQLHKHSPRSPSRIITHNDVVTSCRTSASHHRYKITPSAYHSGYHKHLITIERNKLSHNFWNKDLRNLICIHTSDKYPAPDKVFTISHMHIFIRLIPSSRQGIWYLRRIHKQTLQMMLSSSFTDFWYSQLIRLPQVVIFKFQATQSQPLREK